MSFEKSKILEAAQQFTIRGQIQKAIEEWKKLLTDTPNDANIYNTLGDLCLKNQSSSNAKEEAISHYIDASRIFESSGFALKAIAVYKKILKIAPNRKEIYLRMGDLNRERGLTGNAREDYLFAAKLYSQEGLIKEALEVYRKIADLDPSNLSVRKKIADIFLKEGLKKEAIEEYNKVAASHQKAGDRDDAETLYKVILTLDLNNINAIVEVGRIHLENGHIEEAIGYGKKALELAPDSQKVLSLLVDSYNKARMYDEAEDLLRRILESNTEELSYRDTLASILLNKGDTLRAADEYLEIGKQYLFRRDLERAHAFSEKVTRISPDRIEAHELLFEIYCSSAKKEEAVGKGLFLAGHFYDSGNMERAKEYYLKILEEDPHNVEAKEGLGKLSTVETPYIEMAEKVERVVDVAGQLASAEVYIKYGLMEKAIAELQNIVNKIEPDNEDAHIKLKSIYKRIGEYDKAVEECLTLLNIYESAGEREKMEMVIRESMEISPGDRRIKEYKDRLYVISRDDVQEMVEEARFYAQQGMIDEAINVYERVLRIEPGNEEAINQIAMLRKTGTGVAIPDVEVIKLAEEPSVSAPHIAGIGRSENNVGNATFFDLGEALKEDKEDEVIEEHGIGIASAEGSERPIPVETSMTKSFEEIFQEFQEGLKDHLSEEDFETHYNMGIAYKEMELYEEAIVEFKCSARIGESKPRAERGGNESSACVERSEKCIPETPRFIDASYMTALCHKELGEYQLAIETLTRAISSHQYNEQKHLILKYELGVLLETTGRKADALGIFTQIHDTDPTYRDVSDKVLSLQREI